MQEMGVSPPIKSPSPGTCISLKALHHGKLKDPDPQSPALVDAA